MSKRIPYYLFAVYILVDPFMNDPFYVGVTQNPHQRYHFHYFGRNRPSRFTGKLTPTQQRIKAITDCGGYPIMEIVEIAHGGFDGRDLEDRWIILLERKGFTLTNVYKPMTARRIRNAFHSRWSAA